MLRISSLAASGALALIATVGVVVGREASHNGSTSGAVAISVKAPDRASFWGVHLDRKVHLSDAQWRRLLTSEQFDITRRQGTERPFANKYDHLFAKGTYVCASCGNPLFSSDTKFESGTGWPSFWQPISRAAVEERADRSFGMERTEVVCARCGAHLGHVFDDGPRPTYLRYCMNSAALLFEKKG